MYLSHPPESEAASAIYKSSLEGHGFVMNLTRAWAWRADVFESFAAMRAQLTSNSSLNKRDLAVLVCATAASLGDSYCALAWGKTLAEIAGPAIAAAILNSTPVEGLTHRDLALVAWARKVVSDPNTTTPDDIAQLHAAGFSDREIAELTIFVAFRLAFSTVNDALGAHPDWQLQAAAPPEVAAAVTYGRSPGKRAQ